MLRKVDPRVAILFLLTAAAQGCGSSPAPLCADKPECTGEAVAPLAGGHQMVISSLEIGALMDGFDLDHDGEPDNKMSTVGAIANPAIQDSFDTFSIVIPMEFFDLQGVGADSCVKFALYLGQYQLDNDGDGEKTADSGGDCNDGDPAIHPGAAEVLGNGKDDDCDGLADDDMDVPSMDMTDADTDGVAIAAGDCDDTNPMVLGPTVDETCGDGLDNDCDGVADFGRNPAGDPDCSPYDDTPDTLAIDPLSFNPSGAPVIVFDDGSVDATSLLTSGPSLFSVQVPITDDINLELRITCAQIRGNVISTPGGLAIQGGRLGGVLDAHTLDQVRGLDLADFGINPEDSLLDAIFANLLSSVITLKKNEEGCPMPDIDVDQDGYEAFCDTNPADEIFVVDKCVDGDGTVVLDTVDGSGATVHCTEAKNSDGTFKFSDGISVALNFETVPAILPAP